MLLVKGNLKRISRKDLVLYVRLPPKRGKQGKQIKDLNKPRAHGLDPVRNGALIQSKIVSLKGPVLKDRPVGENAPNVHGGKDEDEVELGERVLDLFSKEKKKYKSVISKKNKKKYLKRVIKLIKMSDYNTPTPLSSRPIVLISWG